MKNKKLLKIIPTADKNLVGIEGFEGTFNKCYLSMAGVKCMILDKTKNPDEEILKEWENRGQISEVISRVPKNSTAYEIVDESGKCDVKDKNIFVVIFYEGVGLTVSFTQTTTTR
jgi:hypothetical protein